MRLPLPLASTALLLLAGPALAQGLHLELSARVLSRMSDGSGDTPIDQLPLGQRLVLGESDAEGRVQLDDIGDRLTIELLVSSDSSEFGVTAVQGELIWPESTLSLLDQDAVLGGELTPTQYQSQAVAAHIEAVTQGGPDYAYDSQADSYFSDVWSLHVKPLGPRPRAWSEAVDAGRVRFFAGFDVIELGTAGVGRNGTRVAVATISFEVADPDTTLVTVPLLEVVLGTANEDQSQDVVTVLGTTAQRDSVVGNAGALTIEVAQGPIGDLDGDGDVDQADLGTLLASYGACDGDADFNAAADLDGDGCVGQSDLGLLLSNYGT